MSYYHVLVKFAGNPEAIECIYSDLSVSELNSLFLKPYGKGEKALSGAKVVDVMSITWTQIIQTERPSAAELNDIQEKSRKEIQELNRDSSVVFISIGRGYDPEDISEAGKDVTSVYVTSPPGGKQSVLAAVANHQWVVAIIGGLVVAGLVAWLGWS